MCAALDNVTTDRHATALAICLISTKMLMSTSNSDLSDVSDEKVRSDSPGGWVGGPTDTLVVESETKQC